jgi:hypothetical protein
MKNTILLLFAFLFLSSSICSAEEVVKHVDANGKVYFTNEGRSGNDASKNQETKDENPILKNLRIKCQGKFGDDENMVRYCMKAEINERILSIEREKRATHYEYCKEINKIQPGQLSKCLDKYDSTP